MSFKVIKTSAALLIVILLLFVSFGFFARSNYTRPVLMYHYVIDTPRVKKDKRIITPQALERQFKFLKRNNYNVISLEELGEFIREKRDVPRNTVVLTFDDGHLDNYTNAYPLLKKYRLPATMFIIVDDIAKDGFVTKEQILEMSKSGLVTIGSHTLKGEHLPSEKDKEQLHKEIYESKERLEDLIQKPVNCFSYPIGGFNKHIRELVIGAGYKIAVATSPGVDYSDDDVFAVKRVRISESSKNLFVFWFESSGLYRHLLSLRKKYRG